MALMELDKATLRYASSFMREVICYNQGEYIQYNSLAAEHHKALKDTSRDHPTDVKKITALCIALESFLDDRLHEVSLRNFNFIKDYFHGRRRHEPRICVKGNYKYQGTDYIVQLIREYKVNYRSEYSIHENSGFESVKNDGRYYMCLNIPQAIAENAYHNARIDSELAKVYYDKHNKLTRASSHGDQGTDFDDAWVACWKSPLPIDPMSCYKSTVIIPMTLWNNRLDSSFRTRLIRKAPEAQEDNSRSIFGYLCFDHVDEGYFSDKGDIDVGYIFADILSLYVITRAMYTELSNTFSKAQTIIEQVSKDYGHTQLQDSYTG